MSKIYTVELTDTEDLALSAAALSQVDWINNAVHERCRIAIDEIVANTMNKCIEYGIQLPVTKDEIVALAFAKGWTKTAVEHNAEQLKNMLIQ